MLPDRHVTFRLLAPEANAVDVVVGIKSGPYEPQGSTTAEMTKDANGLWSVTLGPFEPNLYEYQFSLDGRKITDPGNDMPKPQRQVDTSLLLIPGTPPDFLDVQNGAHGTIVTRPTIRPRLAKTDGSWSTPRRATTVLTLPYLSFTFTTASGTRATHGSLKGG